jgi:hypothetical protein
LEIQLPLVARIQLLVLATFFAMVAVSTILLYLRKRTKPTLAMLVAVVVGWLGVGIGWLGPKETVTTRIPAVSADQSSDTFSDQPLAAFGSVSTTTSSVFPVTWMILGSLVLWTGAFFVFSTSADRGRK